MAKKRSKAGPGSGRKTGAKKSNVTQQLKQKQAIELRLTGMTLRDIAEALGYKAVSGVHKLIIAGLQAGLRPAAEELRDLELARLDRLYTVAYRQAIQGSLPALDRCIRIMERRARYVPIEVPAKVEHSGTVTGMTDADIANQLRQQGLPVPQDLAARLGLDQPPASEDAATDANADD